MSHNSNYLQNTLKRDIICENCVMSTALADLDVSFIKQYLKSLSFSQKPINEDISDAVYDIDLVKDFSKLDENNFESILIIDINIIHKNKNIFTLNICYIGLFCIKNATESDLKTLLDRECPRILFPFLREIVSKISRAAGIKEILLDAITF